MKTRARRAFSLVELMTVVGIIMLLISILLPAMGRAREAGRRAVCLANLRSIAQGSIGYAANNNQQFPEWGQRISGFAATGHQWNWDGVIGSTNDPGTDIRSNTRNVWMLVRNGAGDPKTFVCPSDDEAGEAFVPADVNHVYDVQNRSQFSYSFQYQGPAQKVGQTTLDATNVRPGWNTNLRDDSRLVVAADATPCMTPVNRAYTVADVTNDHMFNLTVASDTNLQSFVTAMTAMASTSVTPIPITYNAATGKVDFRVPGSDTQRALNSANHKGEGQNVIRLDGSGEFSAHPWAGAHFDNIYTVQDPSVYENPDNLLATAAAGTRDAVVRARMVGLYDGYAPFAGTPAISAYGEAGIMQAWVFNRVSKSRFPDSFLVP